MLTEVIVEKAYGTGNDFILIPDFKDELELTPNLVRNLSDRNFGIGADGVIRMTRAGSRADFFMDYWNSDGSVAEMCGNGIRCMAASLRERELLEFSNISIETRAGIKDVEVLEDKRVRVNMGPPIFNPREIPMIWQGHNAIGINLDTSEGELKGVVALSMGNPHLIVFVTDIDAIEISKSGPDMEVDQHFPNKTNFEVVQVDSPSSIRVKVWERGVGETLSCGTGACAAAVAARVLSETNEVVKVSMPGGTLEIQWGGSLKEERPVYLTGTTKSVFTTTIDLRDFM